LQSLTLSGTPVTDAGLKHLSGLKELRQLNLNFTVVTDAGLKDLMAELREQHYQTLVFTRTKHGADAVVKRLVKAGIAADAIHGNKSQNARERALERFRAGNARVLVATDIAARGIDVTDITHVVNYEIPNIAESYVHRIGRTARAGAAGVAISLCDPSERGFMRDIEKLTAVRLLDDGADPIQTAASPARRGGKPAPSARRNRRWSRPQHQRRRAA
jgi:ATP-dependent RNA helicase RhlE